MATNRKNWICCVLLLFLNPQMGLARQKSAVSDAASQSVSVQRDGQHDFDFKMGTWKTHIWRLLHPLTGSHAWTELDGTEVVRKVWGGRAWLDEIEANGSTGHFEGLTMFLYNPQSHQWSLNFADSKGGTLSQPMIGEFKNGRGDFYDQETYNGRAILLRFSVSDITPTSCRFEQAFSDDGGKTWEVNFIVAETLVNPKFDKNKNK